VGVDEVEGFMGIGPEFLHVAELLAQGRPAWMADALCREHPGVEFFPERGKPAAPAKSVCSSCLVRFDCLAYALEWGCVGIWGGTSDRQRAQALPQGIDAVALLAMLTAKDAAEERLLSVQRIGNCQPKIGPQGGEDTGFGVRRHRHPQLVSPERDVQRVS
jgi:Transcription factor WhiB